MGEFVLIFLANQGEFWSGHARIWLITLWSSFLCFSHLQKFNINVISAIFFFSSIMYFPKNPHFVSWFSGILELNLMQIISLNNPTLYLIYIWATYIQKNYKFLSTLVINTLHHSGDFVTVLEIHCWKHIHFCCQHLIHSYQEHNVERTHSVLGL